MTQTEALKLALEALESATPKYARQRKDQKELGGYLEYWKLQQHQRGDAIFAIKEALAQPKRDLKPRCFADFQLNHEHDRKCQWCAVETECKTGMAQLEQEPVAWLVYAKGSRRYFTLTFDVEKVPEIYKGGEAVPLYTTPPQRKPLTDEQILTVVRDHYNPYQRPEISFARAIEAAHGIKG